MRFARFCAIVLTTILSAAVVSARPPTTGPDQSDRLQARIRELEERVRSLEKQLETERLRTRLLQPRQPFQFTPQRFEWSPPLNIPRTVEPRDIPPTWQQREFNGMTYYLVPLCGGENAD